MTTFQSMHHVKQAHAHAEDQLIDNDEIKSYIDEEENETDG